MPDLKLFDKLRDNLRAFPDYNLIAQHHEEAASCYNFCRKKGVQGSLIDFLICGVAIIDQMPIATLDKDFVSYAKHLPINLVDLA